jgi:acid stress-induced BolA-like protein IbaG/YrbA
MIESPEIERLIRQGLPCEHVQVSGDGQHWEALVVSGEFAGRSRLRRQQRVYETIRPQLDSGEIHALSFKTMTPEEWSAQRG